MKAVDTGIWYALGMDEIEQKILDDLPYRHMTFSSPQRSGLRNAGHKGAKNNKHVSPALHSLRLVPSPFPTASEKSVLTSRSSNQLSIGEDVKMDEKNELIRIDFL